MSEDDLKAVRSAGHTDAQVIEIGQHVGLNTWTNYINEVAEPEGELMAQRISNRKLRVEAEVSERAEGLA